MNTTTRPNYRQPFIRLRLGLPARFGFVMGVGSNQASQACGTVNDFDVVNDVSVASSNDQTKQPAFLPAESALIQILI